MVSTQHILRFMDAGSGVRRRPLVGMKFLHEHRVAGRIARCPRKTNLITFLVSQLAGSRQNAPHCAIALRVFTTSGLPAVKIRCR
jgi:hypothetical protein